MTESERAALELASKSELPYLGLRGVTPDPNLLLYLPSAAARAGELVPLSLNENVLQLACCRPDPDLAPLRARFPRLVLELSISPAEEIHGLLSSMRQAPR